LAYFTKAEVSSPCSQKPAVGLYLEPHPHIYFSNINFNIILPSFGLKLCISLFLHVIPGNYLGSYQFFMKSFLVTKFVHHRHHKSSCAKELYCCALPSV